MTDTEWTTIQVEQADRIAAAELHPGYWGDAKVLDGECDGHPYVQAFALHAKGLREAVKFYRDAWKPKTTRSGLVWRPKEELLDDCGGRASEALTLTKAEGRSL